MMGRQKLNVSTALKLYAEAFDDWEQGILEDNLEVFNSGTYDYKQAERFLDDYKIVYETSTGKEIIYYEFSQYCLISGWLEIRIINMKKLLVFLSLFIVVCGSTGEDIVKRKIHQVNL